MQMASIIACVDDTDDETRSTSTGKVAELIANRVVELGGSVRLGITRHQLLLSEEVPYTSHNSSMAFEALVPKGCLDAFRTDAVRILKSECVAEADPGLAIAVVPAQGGKDKVASQQIANLISFGIRAKKAYCPKDSAYAVASAIPWVSLSEHGGDGQGVVGALAGVGLRLSGSDGRFRGKWNLKRLLGVGHANGPDLGPDTGKSLVPGSNPGAGTGSGMGAGTGSGMGTGAGSGMGTGAGLSQNRRKEGNRGSDGAQVYHFAPASAIIAELARVAGGPIRIVDQTGAILPPNTPIKCDTEAKPVFLGGSLTIACRMLNDRAIPLSKDQLGETVDDKAFSNVCASFEWDNDSEECTGRFKACRNCLHRRWEHWGFSCMLGLLGDNDE